MLGEFEYCNPTKLYFGKNSIEALNQELSKYGKTGFFMFPKEISDNQKIKLYEFADEINDYFIDIAYDFTVDDIKIIDYPRTEIKEKNPQLKFEIGI